MFLTLTVPVLISGPGRSMGNPAELCREAAHQAAKRTGVPYAVLLAVTTLESGRNNQPWPWAVNFGGNGQWFDSPGEAAASVRQALLDGATNIDLGCFQLNYRWHASAFASLEDMLDPLQNARYAAEFLAQHYARTGDWALAAAAYHSATPEHARVYQARFEATYARVSPDDPRVAVTAKERKNSFPLLLAGTAGRNGSLFSSTDRLRPLIGGP
ncbi:transglycosylase SLT domain-containing protein [Rhodobacter calidifons]|uniref:Lytic transglycosylase domain-containing protein n=1 Tax=Rhodobacter calidifons TaxID=2715277 RepID=A0ABX0G708_9RHOB|nr:transglycosylase SLT domain-containing protein [Rhodobacter calidifons]NHB76647.1 lytic transglycosylase domain-containing protein [Rhodobacter calidifons]